MPSLGIAQNIVKGQKAGLTVHPGGTTDDGDYVLMTSENWSAVGDTNWSAWISASDS